MRLLRASLSAIVLISLALPALAQKDAAAQPKPQTKKKAADADREAATADNAAETETKDAKKTGKKDADRKDDSKPKDPMSSATFSGLKLRSVGPALTSGRVAAFAVDPTDRAHYFVAVASGGVWKTTNSGTTWTPVFDNEGSYSIGAITIDPKDPAVVWVGSGENNAQRSVGYGDGVYKSEDGGKSWKNMGLKKSEHIGRILIDPRDSKVVYVAAQGPLWGPGGDRGLYKTKDGGKTWKAVLTISENTGVTDIAMDTSNPDIIYAAAWQRRRHVFTMIDGGPESALYKSTDAGETWTKLSSGLPKEDIGRIGLAVSPVEPNVVYAQIEAANKAGGIFRSTDRGATWEKRNSYDSTGMYYSRIIADPKNVERVYIMGVFPQVSEDDGKTFTRMNIRSVHVDIHDLWIDPNNTEYYLMGGDGGVYDSHDRGATWSFKANLPVAQFYDVTVDNSAPFYYVCGGTQDNNSICGPARTKNINGGMSSDWFITTGGDGFRSQVDPEDPNTIYSESQHGGLVRFDRRTGEELEIKPQEAKNEDPYRWNWDSPLIISPHSHTRLYFAANKLFRSDDRGNTWKAISGDLTRQIDRNKLPVMGKVWGPDAVAKSASTSFYGNIVALAESPKKDGLLYVGTDDGLIQMTENGGQSWTKYERFPVPENTDGSRLAASYHDINTVYAAFENHKNADFKPYLLKSTDAGKTWTSIAANLPENGPVLAFAEDPVNPNLLFAGTEFGLFFSINGGQKWTQLKGDFPTIAVRDVVIHPRQGDLVLATFGRGIYILDDITPLRMLKPELLQEAAFTFPVKDALMYIQARPLGGRRKAFQGENFYIADNPGYGATLTWFLKDKVKTKKELRQEAEKQAAKKGETLPYPTRDELRAEAEALPPQMYFSIYDEQGKIVRNLVAPATEGMHRITWDLRYPAPALRPEQGGEGEQDFFWGEQPGGALVMPGKYTARLYKKVDGTVTELGQPQTINVVADGTSGIKPVDRAALHEFQQKTARLYRAVSGSIRTADDLKARVKAIRRALLETPADTRPLVATTDELDARLNAILRKLRGDQALAARNENVPPSIEDRVQSIMGGTRWSVTAPTATHQQAYQIASEEFSQELAKLRALVETDLTKLEKSMEAVGAPWTPGRLPEWNPEQ